MYDEKKKVLRHISSVRSVSFLSLYLLPDTQLIHTHTHKNTHTLLHDYVVMKKKKRLPHPSDF